MNYLQYVADIDFSYFCNLKQEGFLKVKMTGKKNKKTCSANY